jgi:superfamily II DNA/RNA helicase
VRKANVVVATIGRLLECVERGYVNIQECDCLLIDEADKFKVDVEGCQWQDINKVV